MKRIEERYVLKKSIKRLLSKLSLLTILLLSVLIINKRYPNTKKWIKTNIYEKNLSFMKNKKYYEKYFGNLLSLSSNNKTKKVSNEIIIYKTKEKYKNGVKLTVNDNYLVPTLESGIIVFIGNIDNKNTIIVEQIDGIKTYYYNVISNKKIYDYLEKGEYLGEVENNSLYLEFQKEKEYIDYKKYF